MDKKLYKILVDGKSCNGGDFEYSLPIRNPDGSWTPGEWTPIVENLVWCKSGYYVTDDSTRFLRKGCEIYEVETRGKVLQEGAYKIAFQSIRLMKRVYFNTGTGNTGAYNPGSYNSGHHNSGHHNSGDRNSGDRNSGDFNSGHHNSGDRNSGDFNSGHHNSGDHNLGDLNSGHLNSGDRNSGHFNSGDYNSGSYNSGHFNSGDNNSGDRNSGDFNSGSSNSGDLNLGDFHTGWCNTIKNPPRLLFNKVFEGDLNGLVFPCFFQFDLTKWISYTKEEMEGDLDKLAAEGYLKTYDYKEAFRNSFNEADHEDVKLLLALPNFDYEVFEELSGISKSDIEKKLNQK